MAFEWTAHRFSGGLLALDLVNTVVCRVDPARRVDRFDDVDNVAGFVEAAARHRAAEFAGCSIGPVNGPSLQALLALREAVDGWLRPRLEGKTDAGNTLTRLFAAAAVCCDGDGGDLPLNRAAAVSAMRLFDPAVFARTKICPTCDWLFIDRSKNRSRLWCDMAVCGNRSKAKTHYRRRTTPTPIEVVAS